MGTEPRRVKDWDFDVIFYMEPEFIFFNLSSRPVSVGRDLKSLFAWLREVTDIHIKDEDGEPSGW